MKPDYFLCMATFSKTDLGTMPHLRWSSLQQLVIGNSSVYNQWTVAAITQPPLQAKLKSDENGHVLKAASDTISCFYIFSKTPITFRFTNILFHFEN